MSNLGFQCNDQKRITAANIGLAKAGLTEVIEHLYLYKHLCLTSAGSIQIPCLRQAVDVGSHIMRTISDDNKTQFYKYLSGDNSISDLENFIYRQPDLEQQLNDDTYFDLINFNFKDKNTNKLNDYLFGHIIDEGQFETWKLKMLLIDFLADSTKIDIYLDKFYHLYCGVYQDNGQRKYAFKFLGNLGLNYFWWLEEGYLKITFGDNWKREHDKSVEDFEFYHKQFQPFATEILSALEDGRIQILSNGTYSITDDLKSKLETDYVFKLEHPDRK